MKKNRAFTLIELLVVIAIIAILAAILFPVFAQAKLAAKKTQGLAQMKQIGTAAQLYAGDYDDGLPTWDWFFAIYPATARPTAPPPSWQRMWDGLLQPYVKTSNPQNQQWAGIWQSPGAEYPPVAPPAGGRSIVINQLLIWDIMGDGNGGGNDNNIITGNYIFPTGSYIEKPSQTVFVADGGPDGRYEPPYFGNGYQDKWLLRRFPTRSAPWRYGDDGANYVMCDTSARFEKGDKMYPNPGKGVNFPWPAVANGNLRCASARWFAGGAPAREALRTSATGLGVQCPDN